jgi:Ca-activated chloride channel family protein
VGARLVQVERRGIEVLAVLDVSLSMEASDVLPNRLERSKQEIRELFDRRRGDRVGIELFAGSSFLLCPLTLDVAAANLFLDAVEVDVLPDPGTNLEEALAGARRTLETEERRGAQVVILFTDGEGHLGDPRAAARTLREAGIPVLTVGVGTPNGEPIPVFDPSGRLAGYKKDRAGSVVLSRLDEGLLQEIAAITGGKYFPATLEGREVGEIDEYLKKLERGELGGSIRRRVDERFQIPVAVAAVLLVLALLVPEARRVEEVEGSEKETARA